QVVRQGPPDYRSPSELEVWSEVPLLLNFYDNDLEAACSRVNLALTENRRFLPLDPDVTEMYLKNFELWRSLPNRDNYIATLALYCFCTVSGNITVHVENGTVVAIEDTDTGEPYGEFGVADAITLENMLTIAEAAVVGEARYYSIEFDENTGFPVDFSIDYSLSIADDEIGWTVFDIEFTSP
ncbi:MAG: DUF6174 domain-containing protein, partial [Pseudomonadales bacterium]|nr:DUF6174 domain-containing protein [Pseudomonadales bacterium]